jgi:acetyltransferase-like isoleucine patch superfamily enzyme
MGPIRRLVRFTHQASGGVASRWRNFYYRALGVRMLGQCWLRSIEIPRNWSSITLDGSVSLDRGVILLVTGAETPEKLVIRSGTYVNRNTMFDAHHRIEIGRHCMIGPQCYLTDANHGIAPDLPVCSQPMTTAEVVLGDDVWLGAGVVVLPGVHIGRGAIVGAGSVVTSDLPANVVAAGVPARVLRSRLAPSVAESPLKVEIHSPFHTL